ncbi:MAG: sodium:alanine symporter family protein [Chlamydiae bacterium]|nr:sodium:alanine symporter family protein [Chlamydiota bacterium]
MNHSLTLWVVFPAILGVGLYLTWRLRAPQFSQLRNGFRYLVGGSAKAAGEVSRFAAVSAVLAGNFGTGNIAGIAIAMTTGGPGSLVWMWIMAFLGSVIQYASCVLGVAFRKKDGQGSYAGGPMYYLRDGLGYKTLAGLFSVFTLFGAVTVGNFAQINSIVLPLQNLGFNPFYCSLGIALGVASIALGGIKRLAHFSVWIIPVKAILYLGTALIILTLNYTKLADAFILMFKDAFNFSAFLGGSLGAGTLKVITTGFDRGLFATDAGTGIVPILQANAKSDHPAKDGMTTLIAPLMVMIVCTVTGLVLIVTGAAQTSLQSTNMVMYAFSKGLGSSLGGGIVLVTLILFAYTTILAWMHCGEKALGFLVGSKGAYLFRLLSILIIPVGALMQVHCIWMLADIAISLMLLINLIGVFGLSRHVIRLTEELTASRLDEG